MHIINKASFRIFILLLAFYCCKKEEDLAGRFLGNYIGTMSQYDISIDPLVLLQTYPDTIVISEIDRKTLELKKAGGLSFFTCTVESDTSFGSSAEIYGPNGGIHSHGKLYGDSLTFSYGTHGLVSDYKFYVFKGTR